MACLALSYGNADEEISFSENRKIRIKDRSGFEPENINAATLLNVTFRHHVHIIISWLLL